jgi:hypothetical protein
MVPFVPAGVQTYPERQSPLEPQPCKHNRFSSDIRAQYEIIPAALPPSGAADA